jgi:hypothetical protein
MALEKLAIRTLGAARIGITNMPIAPTTAGVRFQGSRALGRRIGSTRGIPISIRRSNNYSTWPRIPMKRLTFRGTLNIAKRWRDCAHVANNFDRCSNELSRRYLCETDL